MSYLRSRYAARAPLGDDTASLSQEDWQKQMLTTSQQQLVFLRQQESRQRLQKWVSIGVTASIPVFGMIWKAILGRRRARMSL